MHYSTHRLTASVAYVTTPTYASANNQRARPACPSISLSKLNRVSAVQLAYSVRVFINDIINF